MRRQMLVVVARILDLLGYGPPGDPSGDSGSGAGAASPRNGANGRSGWRRSGHERGHLTIPASRRPSRRLFVLRLRAVTSRSPAFARRAALVFLPLAVVATGLAGTVYAVAQQSLRLGANAPQVQLAEDAAHRLDAGTAPTQVTGPETVDVGSSLAPFVVVYDQTGTAVASSALLDGAMPTPPKGVLDAAEVGAPNRVTWQPRQGVRIATVTVRWSGGTVMAGRSLRDEERLDSQVFLLVVAGWAATLVALAVAAGLVVWLWPHRSD